ncbi:MaoC/PaaZ C-terminal domain-containing protein [Thermodesulfobacteriota bacterium]
MTDERPKMYFEDLEEGMEIPAITYGPMDRMAYIDIAILIKDNNPIHLDRVYAKERGYPDVIQQGPLSEAYLYRFLTDWLHRPWDLRRTKVRFAANVFPEDFLTCKGNVTRTYHEAGEPRIDCDIWQENQKGEKTLIGEATFTLPEGG